MKKQTSLMIISLSVLMIALLSISSINAYQLLCLKKGEYIRFSKCNPGMKDWYCNSDVYCSYCVYTGTKGYFCPTNLNKCNAQGGSCTAQTIDNATMDMTPPQLLTCSPVNGSISNEKRQYIKCSADETANWFYKDLNKDGNWKKLCSNTQSCLKKLSFKDGVNNIGIKAIDKNGNAAETSVTFTIDSKDPKIVKTLPKKSTRTFINGIFSVEFKEENPKSLILYYGTKTKVVELNTCLVKNNKQICDVSIDVSEFNGQTISYWFELVDIADTWAKSKPISLKVNSGM